MINAEHFDASPKIKSKSHRLNILPENPETANPNQAVGPGRFPSWLHRKLPSGANLSKTGNILEENRLHTVCEEAKCPNLLECWSKKTATFLAMGKECTRNCGFCDIDFTKAPKALEDDEPQRIADSVKKLGLRHVVITMVARDDLPDGGANHIAKIIHEIRSQAEGSTIEVLTSDFSGNLQSLDIVLQAQPEIFNHNIETVREWTPRVRHTATYDRTLMVLKHAKKNRVNSSMLVKSGIMVGLGETKEQVEETLRDLSNVGCDIVTMGQYLQPNRRKLLVKTFVHPDEFKYYEEYGYSLGIKHMYCGPFVRSSYNAEMVIQKAKI
jgi:lipoic acid synthetase